MSTSLLKTSLLVICAAAMCLACQPKNNKADQTQREIIAANASLEQMDVIESELRDGGILIRNPELSSFRISNANEAELIHAKLKLEDYLAHGQTSLRVANRSDVAFGERLTLEKRVIAAQLLLEKIKTRLGTKVGELGPRFWSSWYTCNRTQDQDLELHGIHILKYDASLQSANLQQLTRDQRRSIATRVQRYRECDKVLIRGREAIYGGTGSSPTSINAPLTKLSDSLNAEQKETGSNGPT